MFIRLGLDLRSVRKEIIGAQDKIWDTVAMRPARSGMTTKPALRVYERSDIISIVFLSHHICTLPHSWSRKTTTIKDGE